MGSITKKQEIPLHPKRDHRNVRTKAHPYKKNAYLALHTPTKSGAHPPRHIARHNTNKKGSHWLMQI